MTTELRQRHRASNRASATPLHERQEAHLSVSRVLNASPQYSGEAMKLHIPRLYSILPTFLQSFICQYSFLSCFAPKWKSRFLVLLGKYLYKFSNQKADSVPKGSPILVEIHDTNILDANAMAIHDLAFPRLPPGYLVVLELSSLSKNQYYALRNEEEATVLINSLRESRQETIKRSMGHAAADSYPATWKTFDNLGDKLVARKERIKRRMDRSSLRELEMSSLAESDPMASRTGYYS